MLWPPVVGSGVRGASPRSILASNIQSKYNEEEAINKTQTVGHSTGQPAEPFDNMVSLRQRS